MQIERLAPGHLRYTHNDGMVQERRGSKIEMDVLESRLRGAGYAQPAVVANVPALAGNSLQIGTPSNQPTTLPLPHLDFGKYDQPAPPAHHGSLPSYMGAAGAPVGNEQQESLPLPHLDFGTNDRPVPPSTPQATAAAVVGNAAQESLPLPVLTFGPDNARPRGDSWGVPAGPHHGAAAQESLPLPPSVFD